MVRTHVLQLFHLWAQHDEVLTTCLLIMIFVGLAPPKSLLIEVETLDHLILPTTEPLWYCKTCAGLSNFIFLTQLAHDL